MNFVSLISKSFEPVSVTFHVCQIEDSHMTGAFEPKNPPKRRRSYPSVEAVDGPENGAHDGSLEGSKTTMQTE